MEDNITQIRSGLHQDNSFIEQPREALRFALNAISETNEGDQTFIANEESNELCFQLPDTYIPLGQVYVSNNETVIFSVKDDETLSEIGIVDADCNYTTLVNADLGFTLNNQIDATFRLRRGCERTVYWVDPKIRFFNIDRPELFKTPDSTEAEINDPTANWVINNFFLLKRYSSIPQFEDIGIEETGQLLPGSYNFAIQYLDSNLNPTEWITTTEVIPIYNDLLRNGTTTVITTGGSFVAPILRSSIEAFRVSGSSNIKNDYKDYPPTGKSIILRLSDLDTNFSFYRIAIMEATNGTGQISSVKFSAPISIDTPVFSYDGSNFESEGTIEEIQQFRTSLNEAKNIEQIENRLILGNVKSTNVNFCNLQKFASKIRADLAQVREFSFGPTVGAGTAITSTSKDPLLKVDNRASYTPGEIYSFGIQYFFEDNTISPVFHIPGRNPNYDSDMDTDNELENTFYTDNSFCLNYWGVDSEGDPLEGQPVRHHRFPLRLGDFASSVPFSIRFSNIEIPSLDDTNGLGIIAYQIVQQERTEENTTILDQAVLTPVINQSPYSANSILITEAADNANIETDIFQFFSPQSKFKGSNINPDTVIKVAELELFSRNKSSLIVQDVAPGTSYDPDVHRRRDRDNDGFDLHAYNMVYECSRNFLNAPIFYASPGSANEVSRTFTLDSLEADGNTDLFNTITDNKSDFIQFDEPLLLADANARAEFLGKVPIVVLKRTLSDPYANFRTEPYYYASQITPATNGQFTSNRVSNGDSFLARTIINTTTFYDISIANRSRKKGLWNTIVGVLSVVAGAVLIATGVGAGAGLAAIGFGVSQIATGVKRANINKVLQEEYEKGLRTAVEDAVITPDFAASPNNDDEIRWFSNIITNSTGGGADGIDLESSVRVDLREGATKSGITDYLEQTGDYLIANPLYQRFPLDTGDNDNGEDFITEQDRYLLDKLTTVDGENNSGFVYKGYPNAELYELNPDYERINNAKIFFHLGLEYDCCSDCIEEFPYRVHYSQQSFQEELIDNYTSFLPNNFRDIEGEKGVINDIFKIQNNLYIHTEEALFHLPQNVQERTTGDIVSFIGTGDFFSIPPRKVVDHDKSSAGTLNKWSRVKTPYGVFFVSLIDRTIYKFSGESLEPISNNGLFNWFKENIPFNNQDLFCDNIDNPSSILGLGYTSVYDSRKERVIFSKKDLNLDFAEITNPNDFKLSLYQGDIILFNDYQSIIDARVANGEIFEGIFEDKLRFRITETVQQTITRPITIANSTDIHIFFDTSGSFGSGTLATIEDGTASECLVSINNAVEGWLSSFQGANPDWSGTVYKYVDSTERWLNYASIISSQTYGGVTADKDILVISFCNESQPVYHGSTLSNAIAAPTAQFTTDYNDFTTNVFPNYNSFIGIHYPVVFGDGSSNCSGGTQTALESSKEFLLHSAAALEGIPYTLARLTEEGFDTQNQGFLPAEWTTLRTALQGANPYPDNGLSNFGWLGKWDVNADSSGNIITVADFQQDIDELLQGIESTEEIDVEVQTFTIEEVQGQNIGNQLQDIVSHSWTISYSLKDNSFTSWHSYLPSFYFFVNNEFFSWNQNISRSIYRHNVKGSYQSFYGTLHPHIIEYVSNSDVLMNKIFENMTLHTEAKIYDAVNDYFVNNRDRTFNKAILYNSRQCSGELTLFNKDTGLGNPEDYLQNQVRNFSNLNIPIDNNEGIWTFNGFRDIVTDLSQPLFIKNIDSLQPTYYIDKILNDVVLDENKDWTQQESFRDKYLVVRLIFDNFTDTRLITNYSIESENKSYR